MSDDKKEIILGLEKCIATLLERRYDTSGFLNSAGTRFTITITGKTFGLAEMERLIQKLSLDRDIFRECEVNKKPALEGTP